MQGEYVDVSAGGSSEFAAQRVSIHLYVAGRDFALRIPFAYVLDIPVVQWKDFPYDKEFAV